MKTLFLAALIVISIYSVGIYMYSILESVCDETQLLIEDIEEAIRNEEWELVNEKIGYMNEYWPKKHQLLAFIINQQELDAIEYAIAKLEGENILKDKAFIYPELVGIKKLLEQMKGKYSLKWCNIF